MYALCAADTEMQLLSVLWCNNQLSVQSLFKKVPLSVCIWKWLFSGFCLIFLFICVSCLSEDDSVGIWKWLLISYVNVWCLNVACRSKDVFNSAVTCNSILFDVFICRT